MSILHMMGYDTHESVGHLKADDRQNRNLCDDLKLGIDLLFSLKEKLDALHPAATETLMRLMSY